MCVGFSVPQLRVSDFGCPAVPQQGADPCYLRGSRALGGLWFVPCWPQQGAAPSYLRGSWARGGCFGLCLMPVSLSFAQCNTLPVGGPELLRPVPGDSGKRIE